MERNRDGALYLMSFREGIVTRETWYIARKYMNHAIRIAMFIIGLNVTNIYFATCPD